MELIIDIVLLGFLLLTALVITRVKDLFAAVMLTGVYSLLCASLFVVMDAIDVAFTEAVVGAGVSTLLMLKTLTLTGRYQHQRSSYRSVLALATVLISGALLIYGTWDIPAFGSASGPIHLHVAPYYLTNSLADTGVPNVVTSILASYRGYDTFGELVVIFTAGIGVLGLLAATHRQRDYHDETDIAASHQDLILRVVAKMLIPLIMIFALYVQFHGDYSAGGGFQAGVIFASAIILYSLLFGQSVAQRVINRTVLQMLAALGALLYGSVGLVTVLMGGNFLDYSALLPNPVDGQHIGILLVELGVGITVASVMIIIFFAFSDRPNSKKVVS